MLLDIQIVPCTNALKIGGKSDIMKTSVTSEQLFEIAKKRAGKIRLDRSPTRRRESYMGEIPTHRVKTPPAVTPTASPLLSKTIRNHFKED